LEVKVRLKARFLIPLLIFIAGIAVVILVIGREWLSAEKAFYLGFNERGVFRAGVVVAVLGMILLILAPAQEKRIKPLWNLPVRAVQLLIYFIIAGYLCGSVGVLYSFNKYAVGSAMNQKFAIGIYASTKEEPLHFTNSGIKNPVLTYRNATDMKAKIVADPFLVCEKDTFYVFFEIWNRSTDQGDIAVASSTDGFHWNYRQVVLDEPFHMSYPDVFKWQGEYYMIPEATITHSVRLYKAVNFPYQWTFVKPLIEGPRFVDSTIFEYHDKWWLFSETGNCDVLSLYYADTPLGPWTEHPKSPVVNGNPNYARPGGNVVEMNGKLVRFAQDDDPSYGNQVWAFEIQKLTTADYQEKKIGWRPILKGKEKWNRNGMHQLSPFQLENGDWIAVVDGY
jgi:hypothetical protein